MPTWDARLFFVYLNKLKKRSLGIFLSLILMLAWKWCMRKILIQLNQCTICFSDVALIKFCQISSNNCSLTIGSFVGFTKKAINYQPYHHLSIMNKKNRASKKTLQTINLSRNYPKLVRFQIFSWIQRWRNYLTCLITWLDRIITLCW